MSIGSKPANKNWYDNYDAVFGKAKEKRVPQVGDMLLAIRPARGVVVKSIYMTAENIEVMLCHDTQDQPWVLLRSGEGIDWFWLDK